jgi:hypothetical protein
MPRPSLVKELSPLVPNLSSSPRKPTTALSFLRTITPDGSDSMLVDYSRAVIAMITWHHQL